MRLFASVRALTGFGDAEGGTDHWWGQRISAVLLLLLGLWFAASLLALPSLEHDVVSGFISRPLNGALLVILCLSAAFHSNLGVQVVIEDYVHAASLHKASLVLSRIAHLLTALASIYAVFVIGTGA